MRIDKHEHLIHVEFLSIMYILKYICSTNHYGNNFVCFQLYVVPFIYNLRYLLWKGFST